MGVLVGNDENCGWSHLKSPWEKPVLQYKGIIRTEDRIVCFGTFSMEDSWTFLLMMIKFFYFVLNMSSLGICWGKYSSGLGCQWNAVTAYEVQAKTETCLSKHILCRVEEAGHLECIPLIHGHACDQRSMTIEVRALWIQSHWVAAWPCFA